MRLIDDVAMVISTSNRIDYINYAELDERGKKNKTYKQNVMQRIVEVIESLYDVDWE